MTHTEQTFPDLLLQSWQFQQKSYLHNLVEVGRGTYRTQIQKQQKAQSQSAQPPSSEHLSLKIDIRDQTIWKCGQELQPFHSIQMELKLAGLFFQKSTRWRWVKHCKSLLQHFVLAFSKRQSAFYRPLVGIKAKLFIIKHWFFGVVLVF